jgi:hypothetical protein
MRGTISERQYTNVPLYTDIERPIRRFTHSMRRPCRAAKGSECVFSIWFTQCGRVWFTLAMPRPCHALTMPFFSRPRHSTAVERRPVAYLPEFGFFGYHTEFHKDCYQKHTNPHKDPYLRLERVVAAYYKKDDLLNCWTSSSDISGHHADFHEGHGSVGAGQENGMACVNSRHGHGMLCVNPP